MYIYITIVFHPFTDRNLVTTINGSRGGGGGIATTYLSSVIISNRPRIELLLLFFQPTYYYYKKRYVEDLIGARSAVNGDPINDTKLLSKASRREIWKTFEISTRWLSEFPLVGQQLLEYRRLILRNTLIAALMRGRRGEEEGNSGGRSRNCRVRSRLAFRDRDKRWRKFPLSSDSFEIVQAFRLWNVDRSDTRLSFVCSLHHFRQSTQREITDFLYITRTASDRRMINRYTRKLWITFLWENNVTNLSKLSWIWIFSEFFFPGRGGWTTFSLLYTLRG